MSSLTKIFFYLFIIALIGIQFINADRTNPPIIGNLEAPSVVQNIFRTSCYDCHSNETQWPIYSKIAPISWVIIKDVKNGRKKLNFSSWEKNWTEKQRALKKEIWDEVNNDNMPPSQYVLLHPNAKLDISQKQIIRKWALGDGIWDYGPRK